MSSIAGGGIIGSFTLLIAVLLKIRQRGVPAQSPEKAMSQEPQEYKVYEIHNLRNTLGGLPPKLDCSVPQKWEMPMGAPGQNISMGLRRHVPRQRHPETSLEMSCLVPIHKLPLEIRCKGGWNGGWIIDNNFKAIASIDIFEFFCIYLPFFTVHNRGTVGCILLEGVPNPVGGNSKKAAGAEHVVAPT